MEESILKGENCVGFSREQEQESDREGHLPEPELNPMMNPKLGENLGRWAQVYFTAPPEKRKEAVEELLRELESEDPNYVPPAIVTKTIECPACHERNETGHKFCGLCGASLNGATRPATARTAERSEREIETERVDHPPVQEHEVFRPVAPPPAVERRIAPLPVEVERRLYRAPAARTEERETYQPAAEPPIVRKPVEAREEREVYRPAPPPPAREVYRPAPPPPREEPDVEWLRERTLVGLAEDDSKSSGIGKYIFIAILVIGVAFAGLEWLSRTPPKTVEVVQGQPKTDTTPPQVNKEAPAPPADNQPVAEQKPPTKPQQSPATEKTAPQANAPAENTPAQAKVPAAERARITPTSATPRVSDEPPAEESSLSGVQELNTAEGYLQGRYGNSRNTSEAAKWLWKSVGKQNTTASVLLANLYMQGDGVSKSCDQARVLLVAAAKKGSSVAAQNLRNLESGGCK